MANLNSSTIKQLADIPYKAVYEFLPHGKFRGKTVCIAHGKNCVLPWGISFCGAGHYFDTLAEALAYAMGRGWIGAAERETIVREIEEGEWIDNC